MPNRIKRGVLICLCVMALFALFCVGASAYTYPNMPSDWQNVQVTVGDVTMPLARYPSGSEFSPSKDYMTVEEQKEYGFNVGRNLNLRGWECVGFARYVYSALFYKYPQNATIDTSLAYSYAGSYAYRDMIEEVLGSRTLSPGYSAETLKTLFTACQPGAVIRCGGHSMVLMAIYDDGVLVYDANFSSNNEVSVRAYTWSSFVASLGGRGIQALHMPAYYPGYSYSTGDNTYYELDTSVAGSYTVYNCTSLNVRSMPSTSSTRVGGIDVGTEVEVLGGYGGWAQILYGGKSCWVYADYLKPAGVELEAVFDGNGGTVSYSSSVYAIGEQFGAMPTAVKANRVFLGWSDGWTTYTADSIVPKQNTLTLKAMWGVATYEDVPEGAWYAAYVETAADRGILTKTSSFYPAEKATRAQMITALGREYEWETGGTIANSGQSIFSDIPTWEYYSKYVTWANYVGIANGVTATTFAPNANITREQIAEFLYRLAIYTGHTTRTTANVVALLRFNDWDTISGYARSAVCWAVEVGILNGDDGGNVNPKANATRAEMVTMICRYMDYAKTAPRKYAAPEEPETEEEASETVEPAIPPETAEAEDPMASALELRQETETGEAPEAEPETEMADTPLPDPAENE